MYIILDFSLIIAIKLNIANVSNPLSYYFLFFFIILACLFAYKIDDFRLYYLL